MRLESSCFKHLLLSTCNEYLIISIGNPSTYKMKGILSGCKRYIPKDSVDVFIVNVKRV